MDGRVVYRPVLDSKKLIHIGFAANYRTPNESLNEEDKNIFIYKSPGVSTIDNRNIAMATIDHVAYQIKFGTELLVYYHRFCLQSEYIRTHVERDNAFRTMWHKEPTFSALGFYPEKLICTMNLLHVPVVRKEKVWRFVHDLTI